jgi:tRNA(fMet)-specific endonuclease VapC
VIIGASKPPSSQRWSTFTSATWSSITPAATELAAGTKDQKNREELSSFLKSPRVSVYPISDITADCFALIYVALRRKGQTIPINDLWIAASALEHGAAILTLDAHFRYFDGLQVGDAIEDFLP